jgi:hypothetical protein
VLAEAGVTDTASFSNVYWSQQWSTARILVGLATGSALFGGVLFGLAGPRRSPPTIANVAPARA